MFNKPFVCVCGGGIFSVIRRYYLRMRVTEIHKYVLIFISKDIFWSSEESVKSPDKAQFNVFN